MVNTGWSGGPYGVGKRISIKHTRAIIDGIHTGALLKGGTSEDPVFGFAVPESCPGVPKEVLQPKNTWASAAEYDAAAQRLSSAFHKNFKKYEADSSAEIRKAAPRT
ncbi:MAG: phosphoenolpyruvate carboxykinase (ATP), partial [Myxococcales bacterium]|nr:phosphoenolpyruvate carboxykinase (ATP) [Myxococcales bacterium]